MEDYLSHLKDTNVKKNDFKLANSYNIQDFDPTEISEDITGGVMAIIAPTGSGKTVLMKDILSKIVKNYKFRNITLFSKTARLQKDYDYFPRELIKDDYDEEVMSKIWNKQIKDYERDKECEPQLVILDDVIASPSYKKSKIINELAFGARHLKILVVLLSQYIISIGSAVRNNIRIAFAFQLVSKREREKFVDMFLASETNGSGEVLYKRITGQKYQAIVVSNYKCGEPVECRVKKYTADPNVKVKFPKDEFDQKTIVFKAPTLKMNIKNGYDDIELVSVEPDFNF